MDNVASRLREERERLCLTQDALAAAMRCSKRAVANYESGERSPDAGQLTGAAHAGADVLYILTGQRTGALLSPEEQTLLTYYRDAAPAVRRAAMGALLGAAEPSVGHIKQRGSGINQVNTGAGVVMVGSSGNAVRRTRGRKEN
jgi:transcriptional regulator with XRE-family HTH domain